jgi:hypothetical protein
MQDFKVKMTKISQPKCVYLLDSFCTEVIYRIGKCHLASENCPPDKVVVVVLFCQGFQATLNPDAKLVERGVVCLINSTRFVAQQVAFLEKSSREFFRLPVSSELTLSICSTTTSISSLLVNQQHSISEPESKYTHSEFTYSHS